ncbi:MAG TPA: BTAD domain-containing putative transcriptional regulator, partial [Thermoanaerobaculia bacterium]|nr:BTAD domain-containing putative transcriptional regulator [Thermoanaerobaculia bacterium]
AYLAVSAPRRFHRRDTLLALFWPDLDQEHARAALRRSLYFLRAELGADVVAGRGDEEIAVPEEVLWCDTTALDRALDAGEAERAVELYRGPLLDGLYVAGAASEYQDWLDGERLRLRGRAAAGARSLSDQMESEGRLADAARWCRRALELRPDDEAALRRLLGLLDRSGDRSAALRAYDDFARRMIHEFELEPSAETRQLALGIRQRGASPRAAEPAAPDTQLADPALSTSTVIAVLPFSVRGDARYAYLGEGMVDLLATKLDGAGVVRTVDPRALLRFLQRDGPDAPAQTDPRAVAQHFGAGRYLMGSIVEAGGRLQAAITLYTTDGQTVASVHATGASENEIFELVDELARQLLAVQGVSAGTRLTRLAALTTGSLDALRAYLIGERELRAGRYFDAMENFQAAVDTDDSFALAHYRLAAAAAGCALPEMARTQSDRGCEHRLRLSSHDQLVFSAQRAWLHGSVAEAESLYNTITGTYPDDVEAWFHLGDLLFHSNPLRGRSAAEAREPFERVLKLEPDHVGAMVHLVRISAIEERGGETLDLIERILRISPDGDQALAMRALRAFATRERPAIEQVTLELQQARAITVAIAFSDVALYSGDLNGAENLARSFIQVARSPELRSLCHTLVAHLALAGGRATSVREELHQAESLDSTWGLEMRGLFATLPFVPVTSSELSEVRDALARWNPAETPASMFLIFAMHNDLHPAIQAYLLGLVSLRLGDMAAAGEQAVVLSGLEDSSGGLVPSLGVELRAAMARAEGRAHEGLAMLERSRPQLWFQLTVASPFFSLASQRYLRAELLRETSRQEEAAGWYSAIAQRSPYELIYAEPARRRLAEMALARPVTR